MGVAGHKPSFIFRNSVLPEGFRPWRSGCPKHSALHSHIILELLVPQMRFNIQTSSTKDIHTTLMPPGVTGCWETGLPWEVIEPSSHDPGDATLEESPPCRTEPGIRGGTGVLARLPVAWVSLQGIGLAMQASVSMLQASGGEWGRFKATGSVQ